MRMLAAVSGVVLLVAVSATGTSGDEVFPPGKSSHEIHGVRCTVVTPLDYDPSKEWSVVIALHEKDGSGAGLAKWLEPLSRDRFVVVCPDAAKASLWSWADIRSLPAVVNEVGARARVSKDGLHALGFAYGGAYLAALAFDEKLLFRTACWVDSGFKGGSVPKRAKSMGALCIVGDTDTARVLAEATPRQLKGKVRSAEVRVAEGVGSTFPAGELPYYAWWLGVQEGRFTPGDTLAFDWEEEFVDVGERGAAEAKGGFVYWYSSSDAKSDDAKALQNAALHDQRVRFFGGQLLAWKASREDHLDAFDALGLTETPAIVVYDAKGKVKKKLQGTISSKALAKALASVAANKKFPR